MKLSSVVLFLGLSQLDPTLACLVPNMDCAVFDWQNYGTEYACTDRPCDQRPSYFGHPDECNSPGGTGQYLCEIVSCGLINDSQGSYTCGNSPRWSRLPRDFCEKDSRFAICQDTKREKCCIEGDCGECAFSSQVFYHPDATVDCPASHPQTCLTVKCCSTDDCTNCFFGEYTFKECCEQGLHVCPYPTGSKYPRYLAGLEDGSIATMCGDPHIMRWNNKWLSYHGECDLVLVDAPDFEKGLGLTIHARTTIRYDYSYISSAAIKIGNDTLQVNSWGEYSINGVTSASIPNNLASFQVTKKQENEKKHDFRINIADDIDEHVTISTFKDIVTVEIVRADREGFQSSVGVMGQYGTGKMLARDGVTEIEDPNTFGQEWQVRNDEPMLFETTRAPQYPNTCILPGQDAAKERGRRRLGQKTVTHEQALKACSHVRDSDSRDRCVYDVVATNDFEMAETYH